MSETRYWTESEEGQAHALVIPYAEALERQHTARLALDRACLRLYAGRPTLGGTARRPDGSFAALSAYDAFRNLGPNLSREVVGGAMAMLVRPLQTRIMPVGADENVRTFCHQASKLVDGVMSAERWNEKRQRMIETAMTVSLGAVKVLVDSTDQIRLDLVDTLGLFWDLNDGDQPITLVEIHAVPRRRLAADFPEHREKIMALPHWSAPRVPGVDYESAGLSPDTVRVVEATCVKLGSEVGRHVICVAGLDLSDDPFDDETHDIIPLRWENEPRGWGGISLVRGCAPFHALLSRYQKMYVEQMKGQVPIIWVSDDEDTFKNISDLEFQIGRYSGARKPEVEIAGKVSQDLPKAMEAVKTDCYHENGVSREMSTGTSPAGIVSEPGRREWVDTLNVRNIQRQYRIEQCERDIAQKIARKAATTYKNKAAVVRAPGSDFLEEVKWPADLSEDKYQAVARTASGLSLTVSGQMDQLERLVKLQVIAQDDVATHLRLPDIEQEQERKAAPTDLARRQIQDILDGKPASPSPDQDIKKALNEAKLEYQLQRKKGVVSEERLQHLRRYMRKCEAMMTPSIAAQASNITATAAADVMSVNEARARAGLGPLVNSATGEPDPEGSMMLAAFQAKYGKQEMPTQASTEATQPPAV